MKKLFSLLFATCLVVSFSFAQKKAVPVKADTPVEADGPVMEFENTTIDYGSIEQGSDPLRSFNFKNTGTKPLIISNAKGSCGCTVPNWPKQPILPGEDAQIEVRYDTKRVGNFTKTIRLTTNEAAKTRVLTIKGKVNKKDVQAGAPEKAPSLLKQNR